MAITNYLPKTRQLVDKLIDFLKARPALYNQVLRVAKAHDRWMDYRKFGLMRDDLLPSENPVVQEALKRISEKDAFDRTFRLRRAVQLHMTHSELPVHEQVTEEQDHPYLWRQIEAICKEQDEKELFDTLVPTAPALKQNLNRILNANKS